ncbi:hypothetical protein HDV00_011477 [Rhizophlyctis rosea]|nr:hypothetical protein HDV00_011477 [Rhizophlyctis rosea]
MKAVAALTALALVGGAQAHYYVKAINGDSSCLRPISPPGQYIDNSPVTGSKIDSKDIVCGPAEAITASPKTPCVIAAGSKVTLTYDSVVGHPGPEAIYIAKTSAGPWTKINQDAQWCNNQWANDRFTGGTGYTFTLPAALASGQWVLRTEHLGLHQASSAGGAQFYIRCIDINVTGGGSGTPSPQVSFPGAYTSSTPGVVWNPYTSNNANYPAFGGALWSQGTNQGCSSSGPSGGSGGSGSTTQAPRTTTTTRNTGGQTTTTQAPRTTTTTVSNGGGNCAAKYGQCGGQGFSGPTCCQSGSTCTSSNQYYSQCL